MGKVSEADFIEMRDRLRARALRLMRQLEGAAIYQQMIERDVQAAGGGEQAGGSRPQTMGACESCATVNDFDARFCKACGKRLA